MSEFRLIDVELLVRRADVRRPDDGVIVELAESIAKVGLTNPITVRPLHDGRFEIVAGSHRFAACDALDHREIMCKVVELDDVHAELAMIDENLCRAELSPSDRARQTARRKTIYEQLHPEARAGIAGATARHSAVDKLSTASFAASTAAAVGKDERSVRRDAERGEKIVPEALEAIQGSPLDRGVYLDEVKRLPPADQAEKVRRDLVEGRRQASKSVPAAPTVSKPPRPAPGEAFVHFLRIADQIDALHVGEIVSAAGAERSKLGQRASGIADMMSDIMEGCGQ